MSNRREYTYHLTSIIAVLASLIGAYVLSSKLFSWAVLKDTGHFYEVTLQATLVLGVLHFVLNALFSKGVLKSVIALVFRVSNPEGKEAKSKQ